MALITNLSPPVGDPIAPDTVISFDVIDPVIEDLKVFVWAVYRETGQVELAYDGEFFQPLYTLSQINPTAGGRTFSIRRVGGWPNTPELRVDSCACPPDLTGSGQGVTTFANVGTGAGIGRDVFPGNTLNLKTLVSGDASILITPGVDEVDIRALGAGGGETNTASNVGGFADVFKQKVGVDFEFRTFQSSAGTLTVSENASDIDLVVNEANLNANLFDYNGLNYVWPASEGASQVLQTDGAGNLTWVTPAAGTLPTVTNITDTLDAIAAITIGDASVLAGLTAKVTVRNATLNEVAAYEITVAADETPSISTDILRVPSDTSTTSMSVVLSGNNIQLRFVGSGAGDAVVVTHQVITAFNK